MESYSMYNIDFFPFSLRPLPQYELLQLIFKACGGDHSAIALTQVGVSPR